MNLRIVKWLIGLGGTETPFRDSLGDQENPASKKARLEDPLDVIKEIEEEATRLETEVDKFNGEYKDKDYLYLDEMLTRCMLKLDNIESKGRDDVRNARRTTLTRVDRCINILEGKANKESVQTKDDDEFK